MAHRLLTLVRRGASPAMRRCIFNLCGAQSCSRARRDHGSTRRRSAAGFWWGFAIMSHGGGSVGTSWACTARPRVGMRIGKCQPSSALAFEPAGRGRGSICSSGSLGRRGPADRLCVEEMEGPVAPCQRGTLLTTLLHTQSKSKDCRGRRLLDRFLMCWICFRPPAAARSRRRPAAPIRLTRT